MYLETSCWFKVSYNSKRLSVCWFSGEVLLMVFNVTFR